MLPSQRSLNPRHPRAGLVRPPLGAAGSRRARVRPALEALEVRCVLSELLTLTLPATTLSEGASAPITATVQRTGDTTAELVVNLSSSDPSEIWVPPTVIIPVGQASATFAVESVSASPELDLDAVAAELVSQVRAISAQQQELATGAVEQLTVIAERMTFVVSAVAADYYLLLALSPAGSLGRARFELRRASLLLEDELV